jgi:hypothetical protein
MGDKEMFSPLQFSFMPEEWLLVFVYLLVEVQAVSTFWLL